MTDRPAPGGEVLEEFRAALTTPLTGDELHVAVERAVAGAAIPVGVALGLLEPDSPDLSVQLFGFPDRPAGAFSTLLPVDAPYPGPTAYREGTEHWFSSPEEIQREFPTYAGMRDQIPFAASAWLPLNGSRGRVGYVAVHLALPFDERLKEIIRDIVAVGGPTVERVLLLDAERRARDRLQRLQALTADLSKATDRNEIARAFIAHARKAVGAATAVFYGADAEHGRLVATASVGLPKGILKDSLEFDADAPRPSTDAVTDGSARYFSSRGDLIALYPHLAKLQHGLGGEASAVVPVRVSGASRALIALGFVERRPFTVSDRRFIESLAELCGQAIERAVLYERAHHALESVQRALLPSHLPEIIGIDTSSLYLPADTEVSVGGDWYDVVPVPGGRVGFVIGDVAGSGIEAIQAMNRLHHVAWAHLRAGRSPANVLAQVQDAFATDFPDFATMAVAVYDEHQARLTWASAGHLPPLLREPGGAVRFLADIPDPPIGTRQRGGFRQHRTTAAPGTALLLFTDGLVERREEGIDDGLARLARAIGDLDTPTAADLCTTAVAACLEGRPRSDDVCLLTAVFGAR